MRLHLVDNAGRACEWRETVRDDGLAMHADGSMQMKLL